MVMGGIGVPSEGKEHGLLGSRLAFQKGSGGGPQNWMILRVTRKVLEMLPVDFSFFQILFRVSMPVLLKEAESQH